MAYSLSWLVQDRVLTLVLPKKLDQDMLEKINQEIQSALEKASGKIILYVNAADLTVTYQTADTLRSTQQYIKHNKLESILAMSGNKLNRLILLMAFSTSKAAVKQFDDIKQVNEYLLRRGISLSDQRCG